MCRLRMRHVMNLMLSQMIEMSVENEIVPAQEEFYQQLGFAKGSPAVNVTNLDVMELGASRFQNTRKTVGCPCMYNVVVVIKHDQDADIYAG